LKKLEMNLFFLMLVEAAVSTPIIRRLDPRPAPTTISEPASDPSTLNPPQLTATTAPERLLAATRVHFKNQTAALDVAGLEDLVTSCSQFADGVVIAVQGDSSQSADAISKLRAMKARLGDVDLHILPVQPWGKFVNALNALVGFGVGNGYDEILFLSQEVRVSREAVARLRQELDKDTLVAGARLPDHTFKPGKTTLDGLNSPWNTLAVWRLDKLGKTGFPLIGDGVPGKPMAGVEEVSAIAVAHHVDPLHSQAKLVDVSTLGVHWDVESLHNDPKRLAWHHQKMASKRSRPQAQLAALGIEGRATVTHIAGSKEVESE